jgi:hypothetical protein
MDLRESNGASLQELHICAYLDDEREVKGPNNAKFVLASSGT